MTPYDHSLSDTGSHATARLDELAFNLWRTWHPEVIELFRTLDPTIWRETNHNPLSLLRRLGQDGVAARIAAQSLDSRVNFHYRRFQAYLLESSTWCAGAGPKRTFRSATSRTASIHHRGSRHR